MVWGLLFLLLGVAPSFAQPAPLDSVKNTIRTFSEAQIIQMASSRVQRSISWGSRVRYLGAITLGAAAIYAALDYYYRTISSQAEPSLDQWYYWGSFIPWGYWDMALLSYYCDTYFNRIIWRYTYPNANRTFETSGVGPCPGPHPEAAQAYVDSRYPPRPGWSWISGQGKRYEVLPGRVVDAPPYLRVGDLQRPPLPDWLASHPEAARALRDKVLPPWIERRFQEPVTFANPAPGISFDPSPNINQWYDDPYRSPYVDTDGDGWPDWVEERLGTDPSSPLSFPDRNGDADGDGYTNWEEATVGSDPLDPASHPRRIPDEDEDGIPDSSDPCPSDPMNSCGDLAIPLPDQPNLPELSTPELPNIWRELSEYVSQRVSKLKDSLMDRFPFGLAKWVPKPSYQETSCPSITLSISELPPTEIPYCDNVFWQAAQTYLRPALLVIGYVTFGFLVVRRGLGVHV